MEKLDIKKLGLDLMAILNIIAILLSFFTSIRFIPISIAIILSLIALFLMSWLIVGLSHPIISVPKINRRYWLLLVILLVFSWVQQIPINQKSDDVSVVVNLDIESLVKSQGFGELELSLIASKYDCSIQDVRDAISIAKMKGQGAEKISALILNGEFAEAVKKSDNFLQKLKTEKKAKVQEIGKIYQLKSRVLFELMRPKEALSEVEKSWALYEEFGLKVDLHDSKIRTAVLLLQMPINHKIPWEEWFELSEVATKILVSIADLPDDFDFTEVSIFLTFLISRTDLGIREVGEDMVGESGEDMAISIKFYQGGSDELGKYSPPTGYATFSKNEIKKWMDIGEKILIQLKSDKIMESNNYILIPIRTNLAQLYLYFGDFSSAKSLISEVAHSVENSNFSKSARRIIFSPKFFESYSVWFFANSLPSYLDVEESTWSKLVIESTENINSIRKLTSR